MFESNNNILYFKNKAITLHSISTFFNQSILSIDHIITGYRNNIGIFNYIMLREDCEQQKLIDTLNSMLVKKQLIGN